MKARTRIEEDPLARDALMGTYIYFFDIMVMLSFREFYAVYPIFSWTITLLLTVATCYRLALLMAMKKTAAVSRRNYLLFTATCASASLIFAIRYILVMQGFGFTSTVSFVALFGIGLFTSGMTTSFRSRFSLLVGMVSLCILPGAVYLVNTSDTHAKIIGIVLFAYWGFVLQQGHVGCRLYRDLVRSKTLIEEKSFQLQTFVDEIPGGFVWLDSHQEVLGENRTFTHFLQEGFAEEIFALMRKFSQSGGTTGTSRIEHPVPQYRLLEITFKKYCYNGRDNLLALILDRTENASLEKSLESEKISRLNNARLAGLGQMAGSIAHEINNPLAIIGGQAFLLERQLIKDGMLTKERALKVVADIRTTVDRIATLVNSMLTIARHGSQDPFQAIPLKSLLDDVVGLCQGRFAADHIRLTVENIPDVKLTCRQADISQILIHLFNNAHDAVMTAGEKEITLGVRYFGEYLDILIADSGSGISPGDRPRIFEPFFTTKEVGRATGLGLAVSQSLARAHQGDVVLDESSTRTQFILRLPREHKDPKHGKKEHLQMASRPAS